MNRIVAVGVLLAALAIFTASAAADDLVALRPIVGAGTGDLTDTSGAIAPKQQTAGERQQAIAEKQQQISEKEQPLNEKKQQLAEKQQQIAEKQQQIAEKESALGSASPEEAATLEAEIEALEAEIEALEAEIPGIEAEIAKIDGEIRAEVEALEAEITPLQSELQTLEAEIAALTATGQTVTNVSVGSGTFVRGQDINGEGIPGGTTVISFDPQAHTLKLSQPATQTASGVSLAAKRILYVKRLAVDESSGDVYVEDAKEEAIVRYDSQGHYVSELRGSATAVGYFGIYSESLDDIAVDNSNGPTQGNLYVVTRETGTIFAFDSSGAELWEHPGVAGAPCGDVVDSSGNLWVADKEDGKITKINTADGTPTSTSITPSDGLIVCRLAIDSSGVIYGAEKEGETIHKYSPDGQFIEIVGERTPHALFPEIYDMTVDNETDALYAVTHQYVVGGKTDLYPGEFGTFVRSWNTEGVEVTTYHPSLRNQFAGVAVDSTRGRLYVSDATEFAALETWTVHGLRLPTPPTVTTSTASATKVGATVHGLVNPNGFQVAECEFEYGTTPSYGKFAYCTTYPPTGEGDFEVSAELTGLKPGTTYHYRVFATNPSGTREGADGEFTTVAQAAPDAVTGAVSGSTPTGANVSGTVNPNGDPTSCRFDYGLTTSYGSSAPCASSPGAGGSPASVSATLAGLAPATTYHYRLVATNVGGDGEGEDTTFTTPGATCQTNPALCPPPPPTCQTNPALCPPEEEHKKPPLTCKKGFKKKKVHGKLKCVKVKKQRRSHHR